MKKVPRPPASLLSQAVRLTVPGSTSPAARLRARRPSCLAALSSQRCAATTQGNTTRCSVWNLRPTGRLCDKHLVCCVSARLPPSLRRSRADASRRRCLLLQAGAFIRGCSFLRCSTSAATGGGGAVASGATANSAGPSLPGDAFGPGTILWPPYVFADRSSFILCAAGLGQGGAVLSFNVGLLASVFDDNSALFGGAVAVSDGGQFRDIGSVFRTNRVSLAGGASLRPAASSLLHTALFRPSLLGLLAALAHLQPPQRRLMIWPSFPSPPPLLCI